MSTNQQKCAGHFVDNSNPSKVGKYGIDWQYIKCVTLILCPGPETPALALSQELRWNQLGPAITLEPSQKPQSGSELARSNLAKSNLKSNTKANSQLSLSKLMAGWEKVRFSIITAPCLKSEVMVYPSDNLLPPAVFS